MAVSNQNLREMQTCGRRFAQTHEQEALDLAATYLAISGIQGEFNADSNLLYQYFHEGVRNNAFGQFHIDECMKALRERAEELVS